MNIENILSEIDAEISRLQQAKALLGNTSSMGVSTLKRKPGRPPSLKSATASATKKTGKRRTMSPEGRARIAAAQKARWAKSKRAAKKSEKTAVKKKPGRPAKVVVKKSSIKKTAGAKSESTASQA